MIVVIVLAAVTVYLCRLSGFIVRFPQMSAEGQAFLKFVPIGVFSALIVPSLSSQPELFNTKLVAFAVTGAVMWKTRRFELSILSGLATFWLVSAFG